MSTDALELALALHRAPIQRFALRERALPPMMEEVLQLAAATQPLLKDAAARLSESQETITEAVRFFLQQILFQPGTDAYRVLGVAPDAEFEQIRQHHIWLQRWLHPDRRGEDWEAAFTTKVNWAWGQLRTDAARKKYDRFRGQQTVRHLPDSETVEFLRTPVWNHATNKPSQSWLGRVVIISLLGTCAILFYFAATHQDTVEHDVAVALGDYGPASQLNAPSTGDALPQSQQQVEVRASVASDSVSVAALPQAVMTSADDQAPNVQSVVADREVALSEPDSSNALAFTVEPAPVTDAATLVEADAIAPVVDQISAEPDSARNVAMDSAVAVTVQPQGADRQRSADQRNPVDIPVAASVESPDSAHESVNSQQRLLDGTQANEIARATPAAATVQAQNSPARNVATKATAALASEGATLVQFELARVLVNNMTSYLHRSDAALPNWKDEAGRQKLARERSTLHKRSGNAGTGGFVLDAPAWQMSRSAASLRTTYHAGPQSGPTESGRFHVELVWNTNNWKVTRIELSPES